MSWGPNWSLIGKCVSVDNRSNLPGIIIPQEAQGLFKLPSTGFVQAQQCQAAMSKVARAQHSDDGFPEKGEGALCGALN